MHCAEPKALEGLQPLQLCNVSCRAVTDDSLIATLRKTAIMDRSEGAPMKTLLMLAAATSLMPAPASFQIDRLHGVGRTLPARMSVACRKPVHASFAPKEGRGCCSWHGGQCGCSGGRVTCCDGTVSPSCTC